MAKNTPADPLDFFGITNTSPHPTKSHQTNQTPTPLKSDETFFAISKSKVRTKGIGADKFKKIKAFSDLQKDPKIPSFLTDSLQSISYDRPTVIQSAAIPIILKKRDLFAVAPTGSGKTAAYLIPLLHFLSKIAKKQKKTRLVCVVVVPTRELANQIKGEALNLSKGSGISVKTAGDLAVVAEEKGSLKGHCHLLVSTPHLLHSLVFPPGEGIRPLKLNRLKFLVFDEADKLLDKVKAEDMALIPEINKCGQSRKKVHTEIIDVLKKCTAQKLRKYLFSATLPSHVEMTAKQILQNPIRLMVGVKDISSSTVDQKLIFVGSDRSKLFSLKQIFQEKFLPPVLIFVQSKSRASELCEQIKAFGQKYRCDFIHSDRPARTRDEILDGFKAGDLPILICTDLLSRGIDFLNVSLVVNFDFPNTATEYVHRVGRAGRAGVKGRAVTFFTTEDKPSLRGVAETIIQSGGSIPRWMLSLKKTSRTRRVPLRTKPVKRKRIRKLNLIK